MEMIILTKSDKNQGYCVAGIDRQTGQWVRLVAPRREDTLLATDIRYADGSSMQVLDIVSVEVDRVDHRIAHQTENRILNLQAPKRKLGQATWQQVFALHSAETGRNILGSVVGESGGTYGDRLSQEDLPQRSLQLVRVRNVRISNPFNKNHPKVSFEFPAVNGTKTYTLTLTDPEYASHRNARIGDAYMVISLAGKMFQGQYYLLGAKLITRQEAAAVRAA